MFVAINSGVLKPLFALFLTGMSNSGIICHSSHLTWNKLITLFRHWRIQRQRYQYINLTFV